LAVGKTAGRHQAGKQNEPDAEDKAEDGISHLNLLLWAARFTP
jgi:hypothetical protein